MILNDDLNYDRPRVENFVDLSNETKKTISWIGQNKNVLEVGCHTGFLSEWLQKENCLVTGLDINSKALSIAEPYLHKSIVCDLESDEIHTQIGETKFDVITFLHVLEHITNPWEVLTKFKSHLNENGEVLIALPNINNAQDRFKVFFGNFDYTLDGVMDKTHLRFFNYHTAVALIENSGFEVIDYYSPWQVNPLHHFMDHLPLFYRLKNIFKKNKIPFGFKNKPNLTDTVLMFRCRLIS